MHPVRRQRLIIVVFIVAGASAAAALIFSALSENMNFFYAPAQIEAGEAPHGKTIRVGGLVVPGSLKRAESGLDLAFRVTDNKAELPVDFRGILPDLFAEGKGVVAVGELLPGGRFKAAQVLAKHDENYMPPEVHDALKKGAEPGVAMGGGLEDGR
jgi:cytochrome c-type biogenesis protein CcmE